MLLIDTREKPRAIEHIIDYLQQNEIEYDRTKLYIGDYQLAHKPLVVVDRKQNIAELAKNCTADHKRFKAELERAAKIGAIIFVLIEQKTYTDRGDKKVVNQIDDLMLWSNPHTTIRGEQVFRILASWIHKYPLRVEFCDKRSTGRRIMEILGDG